jgi:NAD(P)-dependent dehydrogenase (short-subunit alcohol dehydrogenase family)
VAVAGAGELGAAVTERARELGAAAEALRVESPGSEPPPFACDQLVWDGAAAFERATVGAASVDSVRAALDGAWLAIRSAAVGPATGWIETGRPGRIVLLAPRPGDLEPHAAAARAGLENLARTLSIEWARYGIRVVCILPGRRTEADSVAELCAFLASPAGDYHSGSVLALT